MFPHGKFMEVNASGYTMNTKPGPSMKSKCLFDKHTHKKALKYSYPKQSSDTRLL